MSSMTKQEAIEILTEMRDGNDYITQSDALQMAIDALEKEPAANSEDAISRQAAIEAVRVGALSTATLYGRTEEGETARKEIESVIKALPSIETENIWVPVSEKLPKENEYIGDVCKYYLIQDEYGDMHVAHLSNVGWIPMDSLKAIGNEVIAWMPLPQPYKGESEDTE